MSNVMWIVREWDKGMTKCARIGYDHDAPNWMYPWVATEYRTASGEPMERTDDPMIELSTRHFEDDTQALQWAKDNGYW